MFQKTLHKISVAKCNGRNSEKQKFEVIKSFGKHYDHGTWLMQHDRKPTNH